MTTTTARRASRSPPALLLVLFALAASFTRTPRTLLFPSLRNRYYESSKNFLVYSGNGLKSDFGGHDNVHHDNVYAFVGQGFGICQQLKGHPDKFYSNHVIQNGDGNYGNGQACKTDGSEDATVVHDNTIYTPSGKVTECGMALADWQAQGGDPGTTAAVTPADSVIIGLARAALGM